MLTFQHIGTARHHDDDYNIAVRLYGRCADGNSIALTVKGVPAYGYVRCACDFDFRSRVQKLVTWHLTIQGLDRKSRKYKKENGKDLPVSEIVSQWSWLFNKNKLSGSAILAEGT